MAIVVFLLMGTIIMLHQLDYLRERDPGFDKDHLVEAFNFQSLHGAVGPAVLRLGRGIDQVLIRVELGPGAFLLAGSAALAAALLTVLSRAARAALSDPVESLCYE